MHMKKISLNNFINLIIFVYILSLYLFANIQETSTISNTIALFLAAVIWINFLLSKKKLVVNKFLIIYLLFIALCIISAFFALDQGTAIAKIKVLVFIFFIMISLLNYIDTFDKLKKIITYFIYSGIIVSIYILINSDFYQITRYGDKLGNVNEIGMIIGISATFCFSFFLEKRKYGYLMFLLIMIITILLTGSRKSLFFILMNFIIILYLKNRNSLFKKLKFFSVAGLVLFIILYVVFSVPMLYQIIGYRIENLFYFISGSKVNENSVYERLYMIKVGIDMFKNRPLFGYGIDNYRFYFNMTPGGRNTYSHNNIIELMVGTGIFGVLIYYLTHVSVLKDLFKISKYAKNEIIYYTFIAIITSYTILSVALVYYYSKHFNILLSFGSIICKVVLDNRTGKSDNLFHPDKIVNSLYFSNRKLERI